MSATSSIRALVLSALQPQRATPMNTYGKKRAFSIAASSCLLAPITIMVEAVFIIPIQFALKDGPCQKAKQEKAQSRVQGKNL